MKWDFDVVVIGSGVAGLSAAAEAADRGATVVVLEAEPTIGGASMMSGGACCLVDTPEQRIAGILDSPELALRDWARTGGQTADLTWAEMYLRDSCVEVRDWCENLGVRWGAPILMEGNSAPRWHTPEGWGPGIMECLMNRLELLGVRVVTGARVVEILISRDRACGVRVTGTSLPDVVSSRSVIVATGGFTNNQQMLRTANPSLFSGSRTLLGGSPTARGSGHDLLAAVGAIFVSMGNIWVYPNGTPDPRDATGERGLGVRGAITELWLNSAGERFHDESQRGGRSGTGALLAQERRTAWSVFDASELPRILVIDNDFYATPAGPHTEAMTSFWRDSPYTAIADTLAELAQKTALPLAALTNSIERFNEAVSSGMDKDPLTERQLAGLAPVGAHGFAAVQYFPLAQKNFGGVRTDTECRVLGASCHPVNGLYAAGEVAGMAGGTINGAAALEGTMFGPSLYSGRIAGRAAEC